jgi:hypothetical protein
LLLSVQAAEASSLSFRASAGILHRSRIANRERDEAAQSPQEPALKRASPDTPASSKQRYAMPHHQVVEVKQKSMLKGRTTAQDLQLKINE